MNVKRKAIKGGWWASIQSLFSFIISFLQVWILTYFLTPTDYGLMAMVTSVTSLAIILANFGIGSAIIQKPKINRLQLSTLYWLSIGIGIAMTLIVFFLAPFLGEFYNEQSIVIIVKTVSINFFLISLGSQFSVLLIKEMRFDILAKINITSSSMSLIIASVLAALGFGVWALVSIFILKQFFQTMFLVLTAAKKKWFPKPTFQFSSVKTLLNFGVFHFGNRVLGKLHSRGDQILIGKFLGSMPLGMYNISYQIVGTPMEKITALFQRVAFPAYSQVQNDSLKLKKGFLKTINLQLFFIAPILIGISSIADNFVPLILGSKWKDSVELLRFFSVFVLFKSIIWACKVVILSKGYAKWNFVWQLGLAIVLLPMIYFLVKYSTIYIVSISLAGSFFVFTFIYFQFFLKKVIKLELGEFLRSVYGPIIIAFSMGVIVFSLNYFALTNLMTLIIQIISGFVVYILLSLLFQKKQFKELYSMIPEKLKKSIWMR